MAKIANVALTNTFNTWRTNSNIAFDRLSQFSNDKEALYANNVTANNFLRSIGNTVLGSVNKRTVVNGLLSANGQVTIGTNLTVSGNTTLGAAGKRISSTGVIAHTGNITVSGNTVIGKLVANGSLGSSGFALKSNGSTVYWDAVANANLTGDVTSVGNATTLATVNSNVGAFGGTTAIPVITVNAKGLVTAVTTSAVVAPASTLSGSTLASGVTSSSLTSLGTIATLAAGTVSASGLVAAAGRLTVGTNLSVSGNTSINGNLTVAGTLNYGGVTLTSAVTGTGKMALDTNPTINNPTVTNYIESPQVVGAVGSTYQIELTLGTVLTITLTGNTPCAFAMPTPVAGKSFIVFLTQAASNMTTATFANVKYPGGAIPTITATASAIDILSFQSNGTSWFGTFAQAFA